VGGGDELLVDDHDVTEVLGTCRRSPELRQRPSLVDGRQNSAVARSREVATSVRPGRTPRWRVEERGDDDAVDPPELGEQRRQRRLVGLDHRSGLLDVEVQENTGVALEDLAHRGDPELALVWRPTP